MRPNQLIVRAYLTRGIKLWLVTRLLMIGAFLFAHVDPFRLSISAILELVLLTGAIGFFEIRWHHERALLDNLAVSPIALGAMFTGPALAAEIALRIGMAVFA